MRLAAQTLRPPGKAASRKPKPRGAAAAGFGPATGSEPVPLVGLHLSQPAAIHRQLAVGDVDDPLEREADAIADQVMRRSPAPAAALTPASPPPSSAFAAPALAPALVGNTPTASKSEPGPESEPEPEPEDESPALVPLLAFAGAAAPPEDPLRRKCAACEAEAKQEEEQDQPRPLPAGVAAKLEVGDVNDPLEREADAIADQVMRAPDSGGLLMRACASCSGHAVAPTPSTREDDDILHRSCSSCEAEDELRRMCASCASEADEPLQRAPDSGGLLQRACASCQSEEEEQLQRKESAGGARGGRTSRPFTTRLHDLQRGGGRPLPLGARAHLESRLGVGLEQVRVHADAEAGQMARQINARAFTLGQHVFFAPGELRPQTQAGMRLLAHEVAHTLQNSGHVDRLRRAPTEAQAAANAALESADHGSDLFAQDPKLLAQVEDLRARLMQVVEELVVPDKAEGIPSALVDFGVPAALREKTDVAAQRFYAITRDFEQRETLESVLMSQWLDAAREVVDLLQQCLSHVRKHDELIGRHFEKQHGENLRGLSSLAKKLRKHPFFKQGAELVAKLRPLEEAKARADRQAAIQAELASVRQEMSAYWNWQPLEAIQAEHLRLSTKLFAMGGRSATGVLEVQIDVLAKLVDPKNFQSGPSMTERSQALAKAVMSDLKRGAKQIANEIEAALGQPRSSASKAGTNTFHVVTQVKALGAPEAAIAVASSASTPTQKPVLPDGTTIEVILGAFSWVDFYDESTTKTERLAPEVLDALGNPTKTLSELAKFERGKDVIAWLSPPRRPELEFAMLVLWADPGGEGARSPDEALDFLLGLGAGARPHAVIKATSMLAKSQALMRYAAYTETRHLLIEMVYQLWLDRFEFGFAQTGDALAGAIAAEGGQVRASIPSVGSLHVERIAGSDDFKVTMIMRDFTEAVDGLGADAQTANAMWNGGLELRPTDLVNLLTEEGSVTVPAMKLVEVGAMADRGMVRAGAQDFARWSSETATSAGEGLERRAKERIDWLEARVADTAEAARDLAGTYLEGESLEHARFVIDGLETVGEAGVGAVSAIEGVRVGVQKAAINTVGDTAALAGNVVAAGAEMGSDALDGEMLSDFAIEYDQFDHKVRVAIDAAPEIASSIYKQAVDKLAKADTNEKIFIVSNYAGQALFEVGLELVGGSATKVGKVDEITDAARLVDKLDDAGDLSKGADLGRMSDRARALAEKGLHGTAKHTDAIDSGRRRQLDPGIKHQVDADIPGGTEIWMDGNLSPGTVIVEYDAPGGVVDPGSVRIVAGPPPDATRIKLHGTTVTRIKKYSGIQGEIRKLLAQLKSLFTGVNDGAGSPLWEAKLEVEKLDEAMGVYMSELMLAKPGSPQAADAVENLQDIGAQFDHWQKVAKGEISPGEARGLIAATKGKGNPKDIAHVLSNQHAAAIFKGEHEWQIFRNLHIEHGGPVESIDFTRNHVQINYADGSHLTAYEIANRVDFEYYSHGEELLFREAKGGKRWMSTDGNNAAKQFGTTLDELSGRHLVTWDGVPPQPLPTFLEDTVIGSPERNKLRLVADVKKSGKSDALLAVVISGDPPKIVRSYPLETSHLAEFLGAKGGELRIPKDRWETEYEDKLRTAAHLVGGEKSLSKSEKVRLIEVLE